MIIDKISNIIKPIIEANNLRLEKVSIENIDGDKIVSVTLSREGNVVTFMDCEKISKLIDDPIEKSNLIEGRYFLDVSGLGFEKIIQHKDEIGQTLNQYVIVNLKNEEIERILGYVTDINQFGITIKINNRGKAEKKSISYDSIDTIVVSKKF